MFLLTYLLVIYRVCKQYTNLSACLPVYLSVCLSICLHVCLSPCLSVCLHVCLSACLSVCPPACLSVCLLDPSYMGSYSLNLELIHRVYPWFFNILVSGVLWPKNIWTVYPRNRRMSMEGTTKLTSEIVGESSYLLLFNHVTLT